MTKMLFYNVVVSRDANTKIPTVVGAWVLPVLQQLHGEAEVQVGESFEREFEVLDPEAEFARLQTAYGEEPDTKTPNVEVAYGRSVTGIRALAKEIERSRVVEKPKRGRPPAEAAADIAA